MATYINNPSSTDSNGAAMFIAGLILLIVLAAIVYFGLPYWRGDVMSTPAPTATPVTEVENNTTETNTTNTTIVVPTSSPTSSAQPSPSPMASASPSGMQLNLQIDEE
jgi:hypothetical protein